MLTIHQPHFHDHEDGSACFGPDPTHDHELPGWIAQWREMIEDPATKIGRPRQVYVGEPERDVVALPARKLCRELGLARDLTGAAAQVRGCLSGDLTGAAAQARRGHAGDLTGVRQVLKP